MPKNYPIDPVLKIELDRLSDEQSQYENWHEETRGNSYHMLNLLFDSDMDRFGTLMLRARERMAISGCPQMFDSLSDQ